MPSDLNFYPFACVLFILLCLLLCWFWRCGKATPSARKPPGLTRKPKPFAGLTCKPDECNRFESSYATRLNRAVGLYFDLRA